MSDKKSSCALHQEDNYVAVSILRYLRLSRKFFLSKKDAPTPDMADILSEITFLSIDLGSCDTLEEIWNDLYSGTPDISMAELDKALEDHIANGCPDKKEDKPTTKSPSEDFFGL